MKDAQAFCRHPGSDFQPCGVGLFSGFGQGVRGRSGISQFHLSFTSGLLAVQVSSHYSRWSSRKKRVHGYPDWTPVPHRASSGQGKGNQKGSVAGWIRALCWGTLDRIEPVCFALPKPHRIACLLACLFHCSQNNFLCKLCDCSLTEGASTEADHYVCHSARGRFHHQHKTVPNTTSSYKGNIKDPGGTAGWVPRPSFSFLCHKILWLPLGLVCLNYCGTIGGFSTIFS